MVPNVPVFYQFKNYLVDIEHKRMEKYQFDKIGFEKNYNFLWDRFIYSDAVYGPVYKNFCRPIDKFEISFIEHFVVTDRACSPIIHNTGSLRSLSEANQDFFNRPPQDIK